LGLVGWASGLFGTAMIVALLPMYDGKLGLCIATGIFDIRPGLFGARVSMLRRGDLSWPPSGARSFVSVGRLMGPKGETPSWTFSHAFSVGASGGFEGFHGTVVVFTSESPFPADFSPLASGKLESEVRDPLIGPFLVPGYADWESATVAAF
jgi:hypothetical protein